MEARVTFRHAMPEEAAAIRELIVRSMGSWPRSADYLAQAAALMELDGESLGFYQHMGGEVTGTEPSGIEADEPLTLMRFSLR